MRPFHWWLMLTVLHTALTGALYAEGSFSFLVTGAVAAFTVFATIVTEGKDWSR